MMFGASMGQATRGQNSRTDHYAGAVDDDSRSLSLEPNTNVNVRRGWAFAMHRDEIALHEFDRSVELNARNFDAQAGQGRRGEKLPLTCRNRRPSSCSFVAPRGSGLAVALPLTRPDGRPLPGGEVNQCLRDVTERSGGVLLPLPVGEAAR